jgi:hypothetical protein
LKLCINEAFASLVSYDFDATANPEIVIDIELRASALVIAPPLPSLRRL